MLLEGVFAPLLTPFYPDGRVYLRKLEHNVRRLSLTPVAGLVALGPASEHASLSTDEKRDILTTVAATAAPEKVLLAGIAEAGVLPAVDLAKHAAAAHFDALLLSAPAAEGIPFWRNGEPTPELLTWYRSIADRSPLPVILASHAAGHDLPVATLAALADHPNIVAVLEQSTHISRVAVLREATTQVQHTATTTVTFTAATTRMQQPQALAVPSTNSGFVAAADLAAGSTVALATAPPAPTLKTRTKPVGFQILWSHAQDSIHALRAGASALLPETAAAVPGAVFEIWAAWKDGDTALMQEKEQRVVAAEPYLLQQGTAALKTGAELSGYFGGRPRLPHLPPTANLQQHVAQLLDGMRS